MCINLSARDPQFYEFASIRVAALDHPLLRALESEMQTVANVKIIEKKNVC